MSDLSSLRSNLYEMYSAARPPGHGELVANIWNTRVYDTSKGWGRVWVWIYSFLDIFIEEDLLLKNLQTTLKKVDFIFRKQLINVECDIKKYQAYLLKKTSGESTDESEIHPLRSRITEWNRTTKFFFKHLKDNPLFKEHLSLPEDTAIDSFRNLQRIIKFEGLLNESIPFKIIRKVASGSQLDSDETVELKRWIKKIKSVNVREVHRFLTSLLKVWEPNFTDLDVSVLEEHLRNEGFDTLAEGDPKHLQWKNGLKPGDLVTCNGKEYLLGEQIGKKDDSIDHMTYFTLPNEPEKLLAVAHNEAMLGLRIQIPEKDQWALIAAKTYETDPSGRCSIIERFSESIVKHSWTSKGATITQEDRNFADPIAELIKFLIEEEMTPKGFTPHLVMYDQAGTLRSIKVCIWRYFSFKTLENFLFECANGNLSIFRYLMKHSELDGNHVAIFYRRVIKDVFEGKELDLAGIVNPVKIQQAKHLCKTFKEYRKKCAAELNISEKQAGMLIYKKYEISWAASILIW